MPQRRPRSIADVQPQKDDGQGHAVPKGPLSLRTRAMFPHMYIHAPEELLPLRHQVRLVPSGQRPGSRLPVMVERGRNIDGPPGRSEQGKIAENILRGTDERGIHKRGLRIPEQGTPVKLAPGRSVGIHPFRPGQFRAAGTQQAGSQPRHGFPLKNVFLWPEQNRGRDRFIFLHIAPEDNVRIPFPHGFYGVRTRMCVQPVIRIRKHHVFPVRPFQPGIAGGGKSGIFTGKNLHPAVPAAGSLPEWLRCRP